MTSIDRHQLAAISIVGSFFDVLGALYLAYDILGGKNGPLRALTRGVTYGVIFGVGFGLPLGLAFGLACGAANGLTLALELTRAAQLRPHHAARYEALFSAIRGVGLASVRLICTDLNSERFSVSSPRLVRCSRTAGGFVRHSITNRIEDRG